jgi:hypothetical protein
MRIRTLSGFYRHEPAAACILLGFELGEYVFHDRLAISDDGRIRTVRQVSDGSDRRENHGDAKGDRHNRKHEAWGHTRSHLFNRHCPNYGPAVSRESIPTSRTSSIFVQYAVVLPNHDAR